MKILFSAKLINTVLLCAGLTVSAFAQGGPPSQPGKDRPVIVTNTTAEPVPTYKSVELVNLSVTVGIYGELTRTVPDNVVLTDFWFDDQNGTCEVRINKWGFDQLGNLAIKVQMLFHSAGNSVFRSFQSGILSTTDEPVVISFGPTDTDRCDINIGYSGYSLP